MKLVAIAALAAAVLGLNAPLAAAQMVVDPNSGERVDYPFDTGAYGALRRSHRHRHHAGRRLRIFVVHSAFPTPEPFGWFTCCL